MRRINLWNLSTVTALALICGWTGHVWAVDEATAATTGKTWNSAVANNEFACDLYRAASEGEQRLFFSPASLFSVLGMLELGTGQNSETKKELRKALHYPADSRVDEPIRFLETDNSDDASGKLHFANKIWGQQRPSSPKVKPDFLRAIKDKFGGEFEEVNFGAPIETMQKINSWVANQTNRQISKLLDNPLSDKVELVATNGTYFEGQWAAPFEKDLTRKNVFYVGGKAPKDVRTMHQTGKFKYWGSGELLKAIELPYRGGQFNAVVLLPNDRNGIHQLEKQLTAANLQTWLSSLDGSKSPRSNEPVLVKLQMPKFEFNAELKQLKEKFRKLGIETAFGSRADFTAITGEQLSLSTIVHKSSVSVDEVRTKAVAATLASVSSGIVHEKVEPNAVPFIVEHPFIFLIRHQVSGAILFLGRIDNPE